MNIAVQRKIDYYAGTLICRILSLFARKKKSYQQTPKKILVILLSEMGSLVLAQHMFRRLKSRYSESEIYGLLFEQNRIMLELIDEIPKQNIITVSNASLVKMIVSSIRSIIQMRNVKIDTVIDCELFSRISSIFSFFSGADIRVGFHRHKMEGLYRGDFINRPVLYNPYNHISKQFLILAEAIESCGTPTVKSEITSDESELILIKFPSDEIQKQKNKLYLDFPHLASKKLVLLYPSGGLLPIRAWPLEKYCKVAKKLIQQGYAVGIIGMKTDRDLSKKIQSYCDHENCIDLTGYTDTIRELMLIFHFSSLLITNDGGPGHFAAMTSLPSIIFYGPETPVLYGPVSPNAHVFYQPYSCSPCLTAYNHRNSPCDGNNQCLITIRTEDVFLKAMEILNK